LRGFVRARSPADCNSDATRLVRKSRESRFGAPTHGPALTRGALTTAIRRARCLIDCVQRLRFFSVALLVGCQPYYEYAPTTSVTYAAPPPAPTTERDASGELPSTAEGDTQAPSGIVPFLFFPFFPLPPVDIGRGYDPSTPRYEPLSPAYGPGGGR
jgi:hypothetical protein